MTGDTSSAGLPAGRVRAASSAPTFPAQRRRLWLRYAHIQTGDARAAWAVVDAACARLAAQWPRVRAEPSVSGHAWALVKEEVARWLRRHGREPVPAGTAGLHAAVRGLLLHEMRDAFSVLEGETGLYGAIARLPERRHDVVVLRYVLREPDEDVAAYLGIEPATVRSHVRHARRRLAHMLFLPETSEHAG